MPRISLSPTEAHSSSKVSVWKKEAGTFPLQGGARFFRPFLVSIGEGGHTSNMTHPAVNIQGEVVFLLARCYIMRVQRELESEEMQNHAVEEQVISARMIA